MIKLGQSSRTFILGGPQDLMPEEGLSRQQRKALAAMEARFSNLMHEDACARVHWGCCSGLQRQALAAMEVVLHDFDA